MFKFFQFILLSFLLAACSSELKNKFDINGKTPDEYKISRFEPLVIPKDIDNLPQPTAHKKYQINKIKELILKDAKNS